MWLSITIVVLLLYGFFNLWVVISTAKKHGKDIIALVIIAVASLLGLEYVTLINILNEKSKLVMVAAKKERARDVLVSYHFAAFHNDKQLASGFGHLPVKITAAEVAQTEMTDIQSQITKACQDSVQRDTGKVPERVSVVILNMTRLAEL